MSLPAHRPKEIEFKWGCNTGDWEKNLADQSCLLFDQTYMVGDEDYDHDRPTLLPLLLLRTWMLCWGMLSLLFAL